MLLPQNIDKSLAFMLLGVFWWLDCHSLDIKCQYLEHNALLFLWGFCLLFGCFAQNKCGYWESFLSIQPVCVHKDLRATVGLSLRCFNIERPLLKGPCFEADIQTQLQRTGMDLTLRAWGILNPVLLHTMQSIPLHSRRISYKGHS